MYKKNKCSGQATNTILYNLRILTMKTLSKVKETVGMESEPVHTVLLLLSRILSTIPLDNLVIFSLVVKFWQNTPEGSSVSLTSRGWVWGHLHSGKLIGKRDNLNSANISSPISLKEESKIYSLYNLCT